jgi:lipid-A-disaccharide synthase
MNVFVIAGEPSGDLHAANCMKEMLRLNNTIKFKFTGGPNMERVSGTRSVIPLKNMAFMGFAEVVKNLSTIRANFKTVKHAILEFKPTAILLVDYPGFNLRMAKWALEQNIPVYYYISPTVWAWKENRVELIRKYVKKLMVILPFEEPFYAKHNIKVFFVGHPLLDAISEKQKNMMSKQDFLQKNKLPEKPIIAVLPGSRAQEVSRMLKIMTEVKNHFPEYQFIIAGSDNLENSFYKEAELQNISVVFGQTYELMQYARAGIIKSGTSTLESAIFELPQVVCYKTGGASFAIAKKLVNVKYISLVNLILDKPAVKELIQNDLSVSNICAELNELLYNTEYRNRIIDDYKELYKQLGGTGASGRCAQLIHNDLISTHAS